MTSSRRVRHASTHTPITEPVPIVYTPDRARVTTEWAVVVSVGLIGLFDALLLAYGISVIV